MNAKREMKQLLKTMIVATEKKNLALFHELMENYRVLEKKIVAHSAEHKKYDELVQSCSVALQYPNMRDKALSDAKAKFRRI